MSPFDRTVRSCLDVVGDSTIAGSEDLSVTGKTTVGSRGGRSFRGFIRLEDSCQDGLRFWGWYLLHDDALDSANPPDDIEKMTSALEGFQVIVTHPVAWGDMDAFAHVNNTVYLKHFENARIAYFEQVGFRRSTAGVGPILASTYCRFRAPLTFPDTVQVGARVTDLGPDRFLMRYAIMSERTKALAAEGFGLIVAYDYEAQSKTQLPAAVRGAIETLDEPRVHTQGPRVDVRVG